MKQDNQEKEIKYNLDPKVYPTLYFIPQQSRQFCDTVAEPTIFTGLHFFANIAVSKSCHLLLFYPIRKRKKNRKKPFVENILSTWVDYRKGRC